MAPPVESVLDMTLDDVIKIKGKRGGGRGGSRKAGAGSQKAAGAGGKLRDEKKAGGAKVAEKATEKGDAKAGGTGARRLRRVTAAQVAPAVRAAAAAAKATAPGATSKTEGKAKGTSGNAATAKKMDVRPLAAPKGVSDKLGMSLDDLLKFEVKKKRPDKTDKSNETGDTRVAQATGGAGKMRGGRRRMMRLRKQPAKPKAKAKSQANPKAKAKAKAKGRARWQDDSYSTYSTWGSGRNNSSGKGGGRWEDLSHWRRNSTTTSWETPRRPAGSGMYADWSTGSTRKRVSTFDDWGPPPAEKRLRMLGGESGFRSSSFGWARDEPSSRGEMKSSQAERGGRAANWGSGSGWSRYLAGAAGGEVESVRRSSMTGSSRIRVSNVPKNLNWRDIKEAFEDNGRVERCEVERGVAWVTFANPLDAKKAVQTFDRGELNGQTIFVTHE
mmetsp:Transcript_126779/g.247077  ORF Transcript_126779/g.247077 Transcript_126779/m.247077 type:complete len:442 (-) Transcript_126779:147-1472(-)|eukprot:CAMPEP_0172757926 /NCGR_PEP_ID=MMETSP1074-20121228/164745_1 /TAXON_ID=2916 /ORGANISM="Ceratium fusus, Strain PA161109" /LENGTH=441 /DNA_ID=CAMNT_0013591423 /DNA_START=54 /DNA_END=1379 /DNA_ORIENTATION=-